MSLIFYFGEDKATNIVECRVRSLNPAGMATTWGIQVEESSLRKIKILIKQKAVLVADWQVLLGQPTNDIIFCNNKLMEFNLYKERASITSIQESQKSKLK